MRLPFACSDPYLQLSFDRQSLPLLEGLNRFRGMLGCGFGRQIEIPLDELSSFAMGSLDSSEYWHILVVVEPEQSLSELYVSEPVLISVVD